MALHSRVTRYENEKLAKVYAEIGQNWPFQNLKMATNWPKVCCIFAFSLSFIECFAAFVMIKMIIHGANSILNYLKMVSVQFYKLFRFLS